MKTQETMKHTPGPWEVKLRGGNRLEIRETVSPDKDMIAVLDGLPPGIAPDIRANADLIAAAPELLAALKALRLTIIHHNQKQESPVDHIGGLFIHDADQAIAKAEGRS